MRRAVYNVVIGGRLINALLEPVLLSLSITDNAGTNSDTATIDCDDTDGRMLFPQPGAPVVISLGWSNGGIREVFTGTVDEVRSSGSRGGGRTISINAKGVDTLSKAKEGQQRHWDQETVKNILQQAGSIAGITDIKVDPTLAGIVIPYVAANGESFLHLGERLAREIGGNFRVEGNTATMSKRAGDYSPSVTAAWGRNLHSWDVTPAIGRGRYAKTKARYYDQKTAREFEVKSDTGVGLTYAEFVRREMMADRGAAERATEGDAALAKEKAGAGSVTIEGTTDAVPDGRCVLTGARPGVDGTYLIKSVSHSVSRGGGWTTTLELAEPQDGAGEDAREGTEP